MADIIPFPDEQVRLWEQGLRKIAEKEFLQAQQLFQTIYQQVPSFECCQKLVEVTQSLGEFKQALAYAEDYLDDFLSNNESFRTYIHLLILDGRYLLARAYLVATTLEADTLLAELTQIEQTQQWLQAGHASDLAMKERQLDQWEAAMRPVGQQEWARWTQQVTQFDFQTIGKNYLSQARNPFLIPKIIEELVKIGTSGVYEIQGQTMAVETLVLPQKMPFVMEGLSYLQQKALANPQLEELVQAEWQAHCALMYPFLPNPESAPLWMASYLMEYQQLFGSVEQVEIEIPSQIQEKKAELRQIYQKLI